MIVFLFCLRFYDIKGMYIGIWEKKSSTDVIYIPDHSKFVINITETKETDDFDYFSASLKYFNISTVPSSKMSPGICFKNQSKCTLFVTKPDVTDDSKKLLEMIQDIADSKNYKQLNDPFLLSKEISRQSSLMFPVHVDVYNVSFSENYNYSSPYDKPLVVSGCTDYNGLICFKARLFNTYEAIVADKVRIIVLSFYIVLSFFAWKNIISNFKSDRSLLLLSIDSAFQNNAFDNALAIVSMPIFIDEESNPFIGNWLLFSLSFMLLLMSTRIESQLGRMIVIATINRRSVNSIDHFIRMCYLKILLYCILYILCYSYMTHYPLITNAILYSTFIPQIIHSTHTLTRKVKDDSFVILSTTARLIILSYFTLYNKNFLRLYGLSATIAGIIVSIFLVAQALIIILQNHFGNRFFFPDSLKPIEYDYRSTSPPDNTSCAICLNDFVVGDDTMVTPCGHYFHASCLIRWVRENQVCPVCRSNIPDIPLEIN